MRETFGADAPLQNGSARPRVVAVFVEAFIVLLIVLPPLAMGAVAPWARASVNIVIFAAFGLWCIDALVRGRLEFMRSRAWLFVALFLMAIAFQMVPLPSHVLAWLSPGAAETYAEALPGGLAGSRRAPPSTATASRRGGPRSPPGNTGPRARSPRLSGLRSRRFR